MEHVVNEFCKDRFEKIEKRLDEGQAEMNEHSDGITELKTDMKHVVKSLDGLTKAIWGACGTALITLATFVIQYIQSIR